MFLNKSVFHMGLFHPNKFTRSTRMRLTLKALWGKCQCTFCCTTDLTKHFCSAIKKLELKKSYMQYKKKGTCKMERCKNFPSSIIPKPLQPTHKILHKYSVFIQIKVLLWYIKRLDRLLRQTFNPPDSWVVWCHVGGCLSAARFRLNSTYEKPGRFLLLF